MSYLGFCPQGVVFQFAGATAPEGWLLCDGSPVSRSAYAALFASIGVAWGDGSKNANGTPSGFSGTHFNLPDMRGRFARGRDGGSARDPDSAGRTESNTGGNTGDSVGSVQGHAFYSHVHNQAGMSGSGGSGRFVQYFSGLDNIIQTCGATYSTGGSETRPLNANFNYIIKI